AFGFAQKADDLLVSKTFLHVQSPRGRELDSKLRRYSKLGGRRSNGTSSAPLRPAALPVVPGTVQEIELDTLCSKR
ncbi:hypothetical protein, partial [Xanthomonas campestris]|uniref:hypothetical protein n=1 Tax=Xanthomonas campestris TaxID=339 RepID=UPI0039C06C93